MTVQRLVQPLFQPLIQQLSASILACVVGVAGLSGCAGSRQEPAAVAEAEFSTIRETVHRGGDDLLTAGLGLAGLRGPAPTPDGSTLADPAMSEAALLRRLAIHSNWKGLADLTATGGFGTGAALPAVPGREFHALARLPGRAQPFRVLLQLPDSFDPAAPCLVVAPASGSRGIYGAVPVAGPWALPRGCAVVYTDKGAGTDLFDHASDTGVTLDGTRAKRGTAELAFEPPPAEAGLVSVPHAHSGDNPEADWGRHALAAARFGLAMLERAFPGPDRFALDRVRVIGAAISNGGGAVLRALEADETGLFDAAAVGAPNVTAPGARPLYDYASEAGLYQPCLLADPETLATLPFGNPALLPAGRQRCQTLHAAGLLAEATPAAARAVLRAGGFEPAALEQAAVNSALDLWRAVAALYASAYLETPVDAMPCGFGAAVLDDGRPVAAGPQQRSLWWASSSGVVPGAGPGWIDALAADQPADPAFPGLRCLRALWTGQGERSAKLRTAVESTRATARLPDVPVVVVHGRQDGLIPPAFSSRPYVEAARANGAGQVAWWEIDGAQHFDVLVPYPGLSNRYRPLLPYLWQALDHVEKALETDTAPGPDRVIPAVER
ncbi:MAG: 3-hydroxybutyrate oligomer hydrolase family protein [Wenzhouxiangellaceae bacterium]|nr:3-hydroxybutyrate oligomer hydrolase family protein [Wenzhouxiangellaceae bacterium]